MKSAGLSPLEEAVPAPGTRAAVTVFDLDISAKNSELLKTHGLPPVWRRLWSQLRSAGMRVEFPELGFESAERVASELRDGGIGTLLLHVDNHIPPFLNPWLERLAEDAPGLDIVACGYLPTLRAEELLAVIPALDGVVRGPLEDVLPALGKALIEGEELSQTPGFITRGDVVRAGEPKSLLQAEGLGEGSHRVSSAELKQWCFQGGVGILQGSAGCPYRCAFCRQSAFYRDYSRKPYRLRPIDDLLREVEYLHRTCGIRHFKLYDLNFLGTRKLAPRRAREFGAGLGELMLPITFELHCRSDAVTAEVLDYLQPVGLRHLALGIESMSVSQLARFEKGETVADHRRAARLVAGRGLMAQGYAILTDPLVSRAELAESLAGLAELNGSLLVLIHEQMALYRNTPYFEHQKDRIRGAQLVPETLSTAARYEFSDPWVRRYFPLLEGASRRFKRALAEFQRQRLPAIPAPRLYRFVMAGTTLRLALLRRVVDSSAPSRQEVAGYLSTAAQRIPLVARDFLVPDKGAAT